MDVSVIIPTFGRAEKLGRCVARLARQEFARERFEVLVGVDGKDDAEAAGAVHEIAIRAAGSVRCSVFEFEHGGPGVTRNRLIERAAGRLVLMLNDDVLPEPDLLARHVEAHAQHAAAGGGGIMVLGAAPWTIPADDTVLDRLVRVTSMVFFYDRMDAALSRGEVGPDHDWGFRHAWTLNLSVERRILESTRFDVRLKYPMYEDLEWAHRAALPVLYVPQAIATHDHRITAAAYLARERRMGRAALDLAGACPACARAVFRRDIRTEQELIESRAFVERERVNAERAATQMEEWGKRVIDSVAPEDLPALYETHLVAKRWAWRIGLLEAASGTP